jgi:hypothetical protein
MDITNDIRLIREFSRRVYHNHCVYCGRQLMKRDLSKVQHHSSSQWWDTWTYDHLVPRSNGGKHTDKVPCCVQCNRLKGALNIEEFRLVFFGGHGGRFWCELFAQGIAENNGVCLPNVIALCPTTGAIDRYEHDKKLSRKGGHQ